MQQFFRYLVDEGEIRSSPMRAAPGENRRKTASVARREFAPMTSSLKGIAASTLC
jgi:hypothetical protein